ncbi:acyl-CoA thioesterase [Leucobacter sp. CSA1]|uniref:Acyl-CoA thioesterase n=1 Tax=Leucobacter chromiisoli TaxID=2796471 RepID=A0A934Q6E8_9MICO|nr:acyl-CoA thioesterase [Leucobacter chromiisoli]MBK0419190.1 acyl-CoA thioesterase [Leucobacter chromiisoli]
MARARVDMELRWGDQDAYGHINNVAYARYLEETRVRVFQTGAARERTGMEGYFRGEGPEGLKMLVASQRIEFLGVLEYSERPITIEMWVGKLGGSSLELHYEVVDGAAGDRRVVARAITTIVTVDGLTLRPTKLTPGARASIEPWTDEPVPMRRG